MIGSWRSCARGKDLARFRLPRPKRSARGCKLDSCRAPTDRTPRLFELAVVWIDPTGRDEPASAAPAAVDAVVGSAIGAGLCERERDGPRVDNVERLSQLIGSETGAVQIGGSQVRTTVENPADSHLQHENHGSTSRSGDSRPKIDRDGVAALPSLK